MMSPTCAYGWRDPPLTWMHSSSRAPELSATLSRVSCWIMLLRPLDDLDQTPALVARHRPALLDAHQVARLRLVRLVVRLEARRLADDLLVDGVRDARLGDDDDGLVHLVARDAALLDAAAVHARRGGCGVLAVHVRLLHGGHSELVVGRRSSSRRSRSGSGRRCGGRASRARSR